MRRSSCPAAACSCLMPRGLLRKNGTRTPTSPATRTHSVPISWWKSAQRPTIWRPLQAKMQLYLETAPCWAGSSTPPTGECLCTERDGRTRATGRSGYAVGRERAARLRVRRRSLDLRPQLNAEVRHDRFDRSPQHHRATFWISRPSVSATAMPSCTSKRGCDTPTRSSALRWTGSHAGFWPWASSGASTWLFGPPTTPNGPSASLRCQDRRGAGERHPAYRTRELAYLLEQSEVAALVMIGEFRAPVLTGRSSNFVAMVNEVVPELKDSHPGELSSSQFPNLRNVIYIPPPAEPTARPPAGMWAWSEVVERGRGNQRD